jgi:hypothetical protein
MSWTIAGNNLHCPRHDRNFAVGKTCDGCLEDPFTIEIEAEAPPQVAQDEVWFRTRADALSSHASTFLNSRGKGALQKKMVAARLADVACKYRRAACELAAKREDHERTLRIEETARRALVNH